MRIAFTLTWKKLVGPISGAEEAFGRIYRPR